MRPLFYLQAGPSASVFHLKSFTKPPAAGPPHLGPEYSRIEVTKKKAITKFETVAVRKAEGAVRRIPREGEWKVSVFQCYSYPT